MKFLETTIKDCWIIEWDVHVDHRGYFGVSFNYDQFVFNTGIERRFVQDNESFSHKNVVRGLHYQTGNFEQAKLVRCPVGQVLDVIYDMRNDSPTVGNIVKVPLGGEHKERSVYVPRGCAHGFSVKESALFQYKVDNIYNKQVEGGIRYDDPTLNIDWEIKGEPIVSEKDLELPFLQDLDIYN